MNKDKLQDFNKPWIGLLAGILLPLISFIIYYLVQTKGLDLGLIKFLNTLQMNSAFVAVFSLSVLPNLLLYFLCKQLNLWYTIKGIVFSVFIYTIVIVVLKFA